MIEYILWILGSSLAIAVVGTVVIWLWGKLADIFES